MAAPDDTLQLREEVARLRAELEMARLTKLQQYKLRREQVWVDRLQRLKELLAVPRDSAELSTLFGMKPRQVWELIHRAQAAKLCHISAYIRPKGTPRAVLTAGPGADAPKPPAMTAEETLARRAVYKQRRRHKDCEKRAMAPKKPQSKVTDASPEQISGIVDTILKILSDLLVQVPAEGSILESKLATEAVSGQLLSGYMRVAEAAGLVHVESWGWNPSSERAPRWAFGRGASAPRPPTRSRVKRDPLVAAFFGGTGERED